MNINNLAKKLNINLNINSSAKNLWCRINNNFFVVYFFNQQMLNIDDWLGCSFKVWLCSFTCSVTYDMQLRLHLFMYRVICNLRLNLWPAIKIMFVYVSRDLRPVARSIFFFFLIFSCCFFGQLQSVCHCSRDIKTNNNLLFATCDQPRRRLRDSKTNNNMWSNVAGRATSK